MKLWIIDFRFSFPPVFDSSKNVSWSLFPSLHCILFSFSSISASILPVLAFRSHNIGFFCTAFCKDKTNTKLLVIWLRNATSIRHQKSATASKNWYKGEKKYRLETGRYIVNQFSSVQLLSHVRIFVTPWTAAHQASLSITNSWSPPKLMSIELVMPSSHLILCHPLLLLPPIPPSIRIFSNESTLCMRWPKYWSFSFSISPSNEHAGLISFRVDWLDLLAVQGTLKSLLQHHSSKASILQCSAFFTVQLTSILDHWKNHCLD